MRALGLVLAAVAAIAALSFGAAELGYRLSSRYAPLNEQVRRTTFEQSRAFQEGTVRDLENLRLAYVEGNDAARAAIRSTALHRLADVSPELLTPELRQWRDDLRSTP